MSLLSSMEDACMGGKSRAPDGSPLPAFTEIKVEPKPGFLAKAKGVIQWLYNHLGDPRSKNVLIFILLAMTAFGMLAPERATGLRDIVLSMPF